MFEVSNLWFISIYGLIWYLIRNLEIRKTAQETSQYKSTPKTDMCVPHKCLLKIKNIKGSKIMVYKLFRNKQQKYNSLPPYSMNKKITFILLSDCLIFLFYFCSNMTLLVWNIGWKKLLCFYLTFLPLKLWI